MKAPSNGGPAAVWDPFGHRIDGRARESNSERATPTSQKVIVTMRGFIALAALSGALSLSSLAFAGEDVPFESLPPAVKATVLREVKGGKILEIERDKKRGQPIYEVEFLDGGVKWELHIALDGTLLQRRED